MIFLLLLSFIGWVGIFFVVYFRLAEAIPRSFGTRFPEILRVFAPLIFVGTGTACSMILAQKIPYRIPVNVGTAAFGVVSICHVIGEERRNRRKTKASRDFE